MIESVLIVEDIAEARSWVGRLVAEAFPQAAQTPTATVAEALHACDTHAFDLALVDLHLPDGEGLQVLRHLGTMQPEAVCIVTTVMAGDSDIVSALSAGAQGYLLKGEPDALLLRQLQQISEGVPALSPAIARRIMSHFRRTGPVSDAEASLTARERDVLRLIAMGFRVVDVSGDLGISESTVASHIKSIYRKLGINSRAEATLEATRMGLLIDRPTA